MKSTLIAVVALAAVAMPALADRVVVVHRHRHQVCSVHWGPHHHRIRSCHWG